MKAEDGSTGQVTGHQFKKERSGKEDEVEAAKKQMPRACKWLSWWKKRLTALSKVHAHILMQKRNESKWQLRTGRMNSKGEVTMDTGWVVIQVGRPALEYVS